jgi:hypothetical protein
VVCFARESARFRWYLGGTGLLGMIYIRVKECAFVRGCVNRIEVVCGGIFMDAAVHGRRFATYFFPEGIQYETC